MPLWARSDLALETRRLALPGPGELLVPLAALFAAGLQARQLAVHLVLRALQAALAAARDDERGTRAGGHRALVNLAQVDSGLDRRVAPTLHRHLDRNVELVCRTVPDQLAAAGHEALRFWQDDRLAPPAHGQDDVALGDGDGLRGPQQRVVALVAPRVLHLEFAAPAQFGRGLDVGEEGVADHLDALRVQGKQALGGGLKLRTPRPRGAFLARGRVQVSALHPDFGRLRASGGTTRQRLHRQAGDAMNAYNRFRAGSHGDGIEK